MPNFNIVKIESSQNDVYQKVKGHLEKKINLLDFNNGTIFHYQEIMCECKQNFIHSIFYE